MSVSARSELNRIGRVVVEVGSAPSGQRGEFLAPWGDRIVSWIVVEHRGRFCRFSSEYVGPAVAAQGGQLAVVDSAEVGGLGVEWDRDPDIDVCATVWQTCRTTPGQACTGGPSIRRCGGRGKARLEIPDGWCVQAFGFTLDPTKHQTPALARHLGAHRGTLH